MLKRLKVFVLLFYGGVQLLWVVSVLRAVDSSHNALSMENQPPEKQFFAILKKNKPQKFHNLSSENYIWVFLHSNSGWVHHFR